MEKVSRLKGNCVVWAAVLLSPLPLVCFMIFGVDMGPTLLIANHSGQDLTLIGETRRNKIPSAAVVEAPWSTSKKIFRFQNDNGEEWIYKWIPVKSPYYQHRQYYIQIEPDKTLYALSFRPQSPAKDLPQQPDGYPLSPENPAKGD
ncbi:MAG TPA: hypothetical protein VH682_22435 [Gemmataceae bacterium]|jgi:hypothetical protein